MIFLQTQTKLSKTARFPCCCCCRTRSKKRTITENKSNLGETDSGVHAKRTILIPKCSNQDERKWIGDFFFYLHYFKGTYQIKTRKISEGARRPSARARRRSSHISQEPTFWPWHRERAKGVGIEARRRAWRAVTDTHTYTVVELTQHSH